MKVNLLIGIMEIESLEKLLTINICNNQIINLTVLPSLKNFKNVPILNNNFLIIPNLNCLERL